MTTETTTLHLPTLHCDGCMKTASRELERAGATIEASDIRTKRVTVQFDGEVYEELAGVADQRGVSIGSLVRNAVAAYLRRRKKR